MQRDGDTEITKQNTQIEGETTEIRNIQKQIQTNSAKQRSHGEHKNIMNSSMQRNGITENTNKQYK